MSNLLWLSNTIDAAQAWDYYDGKHRKMLKVKRGIDDNLTVNLIRLAIDKTTAYLFGKGVQFKTGDETQDAWLAEVWAQNKRALFLQQLGVTGAVVGHCFIKIAPRENAAPRLTLLDPMIVKVGIEPDDYQTVNGYELTWQSKDERGDAVTRIQTIERASDAAWTITDKQQRGNAPATVLNQVVWAYPFAPILSGQNLPRAHQFFGQSDVAQLFALQDVVNFTASNIGKILRLHAHPKTIGTGFATKQLDTSPDEMLVLPSADAKVFNLEMQSDLASSIAFYGKLLEAWHELARIPAVSTGTLSDVGALSGTALRILYEPLLELVESKQQTYGDLLRDVNRALLAIGLGGDYASYQVDVKFPELLPRNAKEETETALLKQQVGVSTPTLLGELGYNAETELAQSEATSADAAAQMLTALERR